MTAPTFRDPPPPMKGRSDWPSIANQLRREPGRFAVIVSSRSRPRVRQIVKWLNSDASSLRPPRAFEAVWRESDSQPGLFEAYVRFVGSGDGTS